ncbi:hypothetical protein [Nonomuraea sp. NPDC002799]
MAELSAAEPRPLRPPRSPRPVYREDAVRSRAAGRVSVRMPLVISGPSFLLLWIAVTAVLGAGVAVTALALAAAR